MFRNKTLLLGTRNQGKVSEFRALLQPISWDLISLQDALIHEDIEETGDTLEENAILKARRYASLSGQWTLADDSGLEVEVLNGEPGVKSHRFAGENATDQDRINLLLKRLEGVPTEKRQAKFHSVIAIASPQGEIRLSEGICKGIITFEPRGTKGFGYDPIFEIPKIGQTFGELGFKEKNIWSHRAIAAHIAVETLNNIKKF